LFYLLLTWLRRNARDQGKCRSTSLADHKLRAVAPGLVRGRADCDELTSGGFTERDACCRPIWSEERTREGGGSILLPLSGTGAGSSRYCAACDPRISLQLRRRMLRGYRIHGESERSLCCSASLWRFPPRERSPTGLCLNGARSHSPISCGAS
jgi:hypothetical protein